MLQDKMGICPRLPSLTKEFGCWRVTIYRDIVSKSYGTVRHQSHPEQQHLFDNILMYFINGRYRYRRLDFVVENQKSPFLFEHKLFAKIDRNYMLIRTRMLDPSNVIDLTDSSPPIEKGMITVA